MTRQNIRKEPFFAEKRADYEWFAGISRARSAEKSRGLHYHRSAENHRFSKENRDFESTQRGEIPWITLSAQCRKPPVFEGKPGFRERAARRNPVDYTFCAAQKCSWFSKENRDFGIYHTLLISNKERINHMEDNHEMLQEENMTVTLEMEEGSEEECIVLSVFEVDGKDYVALLPASEAEKEDAEVYFYTYTVGDDGEPVLGDIEDDEVFDAVCDRFDELLDEDEFDAEEEKDK